MRLAEISRRAMIESVLNAGGRRSVCRLGMPDAARTVHLVIELQPGKDVHQQDTKDQSACDSPLTGSMQRVPLTGASALRFRISSDLMPLDAFVLGGEKDYGSTLFVSLPDGNRPAA